MERYEIEALKGAQKTLKDCKPKMEIELHCFPAILDCIDIIYKPLELYEILADNHYQIYRNQELINKDFFDDMASNKNTGGLLYAI